MPAIIINSLELREDQKRIIADKYISIFSELTKVPKERIFLFFQGYTLDNAAKGGTLFSDVPPVGILGKFNEGEEEK
ncbi:MAG: hypothetical protein GY757_05830 [bacterium]|nr:hypothetical protein [bacterium]